MVAKSHGPRRRTREKFRKTRRMTVTQFVREFKIGSAVAIDIDSGSQKGMPFRRFQGLTGKILRKQGRAYVVEIFDGQKSKKVIALPEHLRAA